MSDEPERPKVKRKPRRRLFTSKRWIDRCKQWGGVIGLGLGSLVYAVPTLYDIFRASAQEAKVQELMRQARDHQLRVLEQQIEELRREKAK